MLSNPKGRGDMWMVADAVVGTCSVKLEFVGSNLSLVGVGDDGNWLINVIWQCANAIDALPAGMSDEDIFLKTMVDLYENRKRSSFLTSLRTWLGHHVVVEVESAADGKLVGSQLTLYWRNNKQGLLADTVHSAEVYLRLPR